MSLRLSLTDKEKIALYNKQYYEANKEKSKLYREANKEKLKLHREANKESIRIVRKRYCEANKEKIKLRTKKYFKQYYEANNEKMLLRQKQYREANKQKIKLHDKRYNLEIKDKLTDSYVRHVIKHRLPNLRSVSDEDLTIEKISILLYRINLNNSSQKIREQLINQLNIHFKQLNEGDNVTNSTKAA